MPRLRLEAHDEYMHDTEGASNFNESMYFNFFDPDARLGGFLRLGNRPHEGHAEQTTCLYLPDGRVAFMYQRPEISGNDAFDAGGCRFEVVRPFEELGVHYAGPAILLDDPSVLTDPRRAFKESEWTEALVRLDYRGLSPMYGGEPEANDEESLLEPAPEQQFAKGHYEQHVGARGAVTVGEETWAIDGYGLRDHSWGPRYWQAPWWYRWLTGNVGEDFGFMLSIITGRDGTSHRAGIVFSDGRYHRVRDCRLETEYGADHSQRRISAWARTDSDEYRISGSVLSLVPLRNRRRTPEGDDLTTRIAEGMTEWIVEGVGTGHGLAEYLDQVVDGVPVGLAEE